MGWFVYLVRCRDGTLYTGVTIDPEARVRAHNAGRGARYTRARRPVVLVHAEPARGRSRALCRESAIKRWPRARKERLVTEGRGPRPGRASACATASPPPRGAVPTSPPARGGTRRPSE